MNFPENTPWVEKHRAKGKLAQMEIELNAEYDRLMRGDVFELGNVKRREEIANQLRSIGERK